MRLLVGVDGSDWSLQALDDVISRARKVDDEVTVAVYSTEENLADVEATVRNRLAELEFDATVEVIEESPESRLLELAETGGYDRIVMSGGQRSPLGKIELDSVIEFVLLNAHTSVTLVR